MAIDAGVEHRRCEAASPRPRLGFVHEPPADTAAAPAGFDDKGLDYRLAALFERGPLEDVQQAGHFAVDLGDDNAVIRALARRSNRALISRSSTS